MKLTDVEINELVKIVENSNFYYGIGVGEEPNVCCDDVEAFWKTDNGTFDDETLSKIKTTLKNFQETVFLFPMGTHCGSLIFQTGWVHDGACEEDLIESVMPQRGL